MRILYLGNKLSKHGYTPTGIEILGPLLKQEGYTVYYASSIRNKLGRLIDMLFSIIKLAVKVDVVLIDTYSTSSFNYALASAKLCNVLGIKYIPILRGGNLPERLKRSPKQCKTILGKSQTNIVLSSYMQKAVRSAGFMNVLIPNSITIEQYPFKQRGPNFKRILWVRSFHKIYNPEMALRVLDKVLEKYPDIRLTMVGPDKDGSLEQCKQLARELNIEKSVRFTGRLSKAEWIKLSQKHDLFINTSDIDNMPVSIIEAMALGLPVISTNAGGIPSLVDNGINGLLVSQNDVEGMYSQIDAIINNAVDVNKLTRNARSTVEQYDWQYLKFQWQKVLSEAVTNARFV